MRLGPAAARLGVHPWTLRQWADSGKIPHTRAGFDRRFRSEDIDALLGMSADGGARARREALYVRVSGSSGQESSLAAQEVELRQSSAGPVAAVFKDRASGLRENRSGLARLLAAASRGEFTVVRVTHEDRLARFGTAWLTALLDRDGVAVEVLHPKAAAGGHEELLADFMSLIATFSGRLYGMRSREAKARLLKAASASCASSAEPVCQTVLGE